MPRHVPVSIALLSSLLVTTSVFAQQRGRTPAPVSQQASAAGGHIRGMVRDDIGSAVGGVMVVAMGTTLASVKSDSTGRYALTLPPGEYILRAARDGYVSTFHEPVRMQTSVELERNITLVRQGATTRPVMLAGVGDLTSLMQFPASTSTAAAGKDADHAHDEAAWRLRYLPRTALRDVAPGADIVAGDTAIDPREHPGYSYAAPGGSNASSLFASAGLQGQVNYLTTNLLPGSSFNTGTDLARGVASASVGAPVSNVGDWIVKGAFNAGGLTSWALHGEYRSRENQTHVLTLGMSHSAQVVTDRSGTLTGPVQSRSVGGIYGYDRWHASRLLELNYGLRFDRYDYLTTGPLLSPRAGLRLQVAPGTYAVVSGSYDRVAPGAGEFLPPAATGPWLPPQRTFSSLGGAPLSAESIETYQVGLDQQFGSADHQRTVSVRRFRQSIDDQVATLFGVEVEGDVDHYLVATAGDVQIDGWSVGIGGALSQYVRGQVNYSLGQAAWTHEPASAALGRAAGSTMRDNRESIHDLTTAITGSFPSTATAVSFVYRMSSAFSQTGAVSRLPGFDGRFDVEVHQALPYQPIRGGKLEVLFAVRNLFYDAHDTRSLYDELLTVKPPMRLVGGIQIRF